VARRRIVRRPTGERCRFCRDGDTKVDYKDIANLQRLVSGESALFSKKRSGNCSRHQRQVKQAVKRARFLALLPYL
jgi:small subunit ribosomal protein S18